VILVLVHLTPPQHSAFYTARVLGKLADVIFQAQRAGETIGKAVDSVCLATIQTVTKEKEPLGGVQEALAA